MNEPNLFIVGFQKCGSSSLYHLLTEHPDINGTIPKETFYLTDTNYDNYNYEKNIDNPNSSWNSFTQKTEGKYLLEASVCNFYQENALNYIKSRENTKVIFIIRDPIKRFISNYKYYLGKKNGIPYKMDIDSYLQNIINGYFKQHKLRYAIEHGKYYKYIMQWENAIGSDRIFILSLEQLKANFNHTINSLFNYLNIEQINLTSLPQKNQSLNYRNYRIHYLVTRIFGGTNIIPKSFKKMYNNLSRKKIDVSLNEDSIGFLEKTYMQEYKNFYSYFKP